MVQQFYTAVNHGVLQPYFFPYFDVFYSVLQKKTHLRLEVTAASIFCGYEKDATLDHETKHSSKLQ